MKKSVFIVLAVLISLIGGAPSVMAHCPLCTAGAGAGIMAARLYGIDDSIVGIFIGALIVSSALWFNKWLKKKIDFPLQEAVLVILTFFMTVVPFYYAGLITNFEMVRSMPEHHSILGFGVFGIDKLLLGIIVGTLGIWFVFRLSDSIKEARQKVLWPYQGLSFMMIAVFILSLAFWILTALWGLA